MPDGAEERSFFQRLKDSITGSLNRASLDYNAIRPYLDRIAKQNASYQGAPVEGVTSMITNRVKGAYALYNSPLAFYRAGLSGFQWAQYFFGNSNLNNDVYDAGMDVLRNIDWSLRGLATITVTGAYLKSGGRQEIESHVRTRYEQQRNALIVSATASMGVTKVLKTVGTVVQTDWQRITVRGAIRAWQITGLVGFCYGLSRLHEAMEEHNHFGMYLKKRRDAYLTMAPTPALREFEDAAREIVLYGMLT